VGEERKVQEKGGEKGARLHFLLLCLQVENVSFLAKWSLAPFILGAKATCFGTI